MIDIENKVFNDVAEALKTKFKTEYPKLTIYGEYVEVPSSFPCVTLVEESNSVYLNSQDDVGVEHHASLMYEVNVYANDTNGKKALAKSIADVVDTEMAKMKFTRTMRSQIPNQDRTIYRITMRYTAVVGQARSDEDGNLIYQMYTK